MSVQVRQPSEQPQANVQRRSLGQKECAEKIAQAMVFGLLIFAGAVALPATLAHFFLGYLALKQFYVVAYWIGLQRRLKRGESVEIVTTAHEHPLNSSGVLAVAVTAFFALACTIASIVVFLSLTLSAGAVAFFAMMNVGVWWFAGYVWRRVWPAPVTRAIIRAASDSQTRTTGSTTQDFDPLAFDLEGAPQATATTASHPVSQRKHWWTDTQLRDENRPNVSSNER